MNNARNKVTFAIFTFALLAVVGLADASAQTSNGTKSNPESKPQSVNNGGNGNPGASTSNSNKNNGNPSSNGSNGNPGTSTSASTGSSNGNPGTSTSNSNKNNGNPASNGSNGNPGMSKPSSSNGSNGNPGSNNSNSNKNNGNPSSNGSNGNPGNSNGNKNNGNPGNSNPSIREIVSDQSVGMMQVPNGEVVHIVKGDEGSMHSANLSKPVRNLVMKVASSNRDSESVLIFDQDFVIDTQDVNCGEAGLLRGCLVKEGNVLRVLGGTGTIRFTGKTSNVTWTAVSTDEDLKVNFGVPQVIWAMPER